MVYKTQTISFFFFLFKSSQSQKSKSKAYLSQFGCQKKKVCKNSLDGEECEINFWFLGLFQIPTVMQSFVCPKWFFVLATSQKLYSTFHFENALNWELRVNAVQSNSGFLIFDRGFLSTGRKSKSFLEIFIRLNGWVKG